jgi:hypothetical protein
LVARSIFPWDYDSGPIFDITGGPGAFTARDIQGLRRETVHGATLEDLVASVESMPEPAAGESMFRWVRSVSALPLPEPPSRHLIRIISARRSRKEEIALYES